IVHRETILHANSRAASIRGLRQCDLVGRSVLALFCDEDHERVTELFARRLAGDSGASEYPLRMQTRDGKAVWMTCTDAVVDFAGQPALLTTAIEAPQPGAATHASAGPDGQEQLTLNSIADGIVTTDSAGGITYANSAALATIGVDAQNATGRTLAQLVSLMDETDRKPMRDPVARCLSERRRVSLGRTAVLLAATGDEHSIELSVAPLQVGDAPPHGTVIVLRDVTEQRGIARQMSYQASHDALTGLLNRREFERRLGIALHGITQTSSQQVICYLDLDRFKVVNDTCGHVAGDHLLRQLAGLIREKVRDSDTVARLGGDEFGMLLSGCPLEKARQIADDVCNVVEDHRFVWRDKVFSVSVSIGLVELGPQSGNVEDAMSAADSACYVAKQRGRSRVHVYSSKDEATARHRGEIAWLQRLQRALKDDAFILFSQPIVATGDSDRGGPACEVLLRLRDEHGGEIGPGQFGEAAQRYHLMPHIDRWVINATLTAIAAGGIRLPANRRCTVNLSGQTLSDPQFLEYVVECLDESAVDPRQLCFEVTETAVISNLAHAKRFIDVLHGLGCHFALDDFGCGMGSFANLKNLHMDYIKIDGSFTRNLGEDAINQAMVAAMVKLARSLGIRVVAEEVENQSALDAVRRIGVDFVQGHVIGRPGPLIDRPGG
ncbi:MAG: EAL domain-containing protein, partial [Gammaproteobacteria bacterium]|nr:EAL domain-containing protein [Gammaproteobacteria bacterium]